MTVRRAIRDRVVAFVTGLTDDAIGWSLIFFGVLVLTGVDRLIRILVEVTR